jgi:hypothetical protein
MKRRRKIREDSDDFLPGNMFEVESEGEENKRKERIYRERLLLDVKKSRRARAKQCRVDVNEFCEFVGKDAESGRGIIQEDIHVEFQALANNCSRLIVMSHPESGKTTQLGILRSLWLLGNNPNLRIACLSKTDKNATKTTRAIKEYIEKNEELAEVFPDLLPSVPWGESFFTVRRPTFSKDPSVQALGIDGSPAGSRIDVLIIDDVLDLENTLSANERKKVLRRIRGAFLERLSSDGVVIFLSNAWHPEDTAHVFEKESSNEENDWIVARFPVIDEDGKFSWSSKWSKERIDKARLDLGPLEFARAFLCVARDEGESPFDKDAIELSVDRARDLGISLVYSVDRSDIPEDAFIYTGVDLAVTKNKSSHLTALTTGLLWPDDMSRQLLWVESGRWSTREIRDRIIDHHKRYGATFIVENNAAQRWIIDIVYNQSDLPPEDRCLPAIVPFTTGKNKAHPQYGVEGLAAEIAANKWIVPKTGADKAVKEVVELIGEMLYYSRGSHTGDRLMSMWFMREGCRRGVMAGRPEKERDDGNIGVRVFG